VHLEFNRASQPLSLEGRAIIDPMEIFHTRERRDLAAAVRFYCGRDHNNAHAASADSLATAEVLDAMLGRYSDLPRTVSDLYQHLKNPNAVDSDGKFARVEGEIRFAFGQYRGQPLDAIARRKPDYLQWMLTQDFFDDTKAVVKDALRRSRRPAMA
jgi:DNA polymerase-3 subunit epsilon